MDCKLSILFLTILVPAIKIAAGDTPFTMVEAGKTDYPDRNGCNNCLRIYC